MNKFIMLTLTLLLQFRSYADEVQNINNPQEVLALQKKMNKEIIVALKTVKGMPVIESHLSDLINKINSGEVKIQFQKGNQESRGSNFVDEGCNCNVINLSSEFIDSGIASTLIHEFKHVKQNMEIEKLIKSSPLLDKLTDIFGEFYYNNNQDVKKDPLFTQALFVGSALMFYMEYDAFKIQVAAKNLGIKDVVRPEKNEIDVMNTVANDYFIKHSINVDEQYLRRLASLADKMTITDFILTVGKNKAFENYFQKLQASSN